MLAESGHVLEGQRKLASNLGMQNRLEADFFKCSDSSSLVEEQTQLGNETDVREGDVIAHQELAAGRQGLIDPAGIDGERVTRSCMNLGRNGCADQRQQVNLRIAREHQTRIKETVHARRLIDIASVQRKSALTKAGDGAHDAVGFENSRLAIRAESGWDCAEWMRRHECAGLVKARSLEANLAHL